MTADEFAGLCDFAAGSVKGVRSFKVDQLGRLTGVSYEKVWRPGENQSECFAEEVYANRAITYYINHPAFAYTDVSQIMSGGYVTTTKPPSDKPAPRVKKSHTMAACKCGFYGYYDGSDDYHKEGYVSAVVEGYGETLIGTRGFRAAKARILAIQIPDEYPLPVANRVRRNYPDVASFGTFNDMVRAFPPDQEMSPSPEKDDDFWTRSLP